MSRRDVAIPILATLLSVGCAQDPQERMNAAMNTPTDIMMQVVSIQPRAGFAGEVSLTDQAEPDTIVEVRLLSQAAPLGKHSGETVRFYLADPQAAFGPEPLVGQSRRIRVTRQYRLREGLRFGLEPVWANP